METKKFYVKESLYVRIPRALNHLKHANGVRVDIKRNVTQIRYYADKENNGLLKPVNKNVELELYKNMGMIPYVNMVITVRSHVCVRIYSDKTRRYPYHVEAEMNNEENAEVEYVEYYNLPHCRKLKVSGGGYVEIRDSVFHKQADKIYYRPIVVFSGQLPLNDDKNIILAEAESKSIENHLDVLVAMNKLAEDYLVIPLPTKQEAKTVCEYKPSILKTAEETEDYGEAVKTAKEIIAANKLK